MIIDKVESFWTPEDKAKLVEIHKQQVAVLNSLRIDRETRRAPNINILNELGKLDEQERDLRLAVEARYISANNQRAILADAKEIINAIEKEDYLSLVAERFKHIATLQANGAREDSLDILRELAVENYKNCYSFFLSSLRVQLNALADNGNGEEKVYALIDKRVSLWYVRPLPDYFPLAHGKATDALSFMNSRGAEIDSVTGDAKIDKFGVQLVILKLRDLKASLGINTDKLLSTAIAAFTDQNDFRHSKTHPPKREVTIPLKEYVRLLGYDIDEHETSTPEEAAKEKKRAKNQFDNARKAIKKDLDIIHASTLTWEEPIKEGHFGKKETRNFDRVSLVTRTSLGSGVIRISFSPEIADYLAARNLITQYPTKLLGIPATKPTAYYIGRKLAEHYNLDNNQINKTHDRISIPALLAVTNLPTFEQVQAKDRGHWEERIKEPLEQALDTLTNEVGFLKNWEYTHAKGVKLTEEEAGNINSYAAFSKLYLLFDPADKVDHTTRILEKQAAREKAIEKYKTKRKAAGKKKTTNKDSNTKGQD